MRHTTLLKVLWWVCLFIAPLILASIELFHPAGFTNIQGGMYGYLCKPEPYSPKFAALAYFGPQWWFTLHMIQTPTVALVAVGLWILADLNSASSSGLVTLLSWLSRLSTFVFLIYYTTLDSIGGSGLGRTILNTQMLEAQGQLSASQVNGVATVLNTTWVDPWVGGVGSFVSLTGSWAVFAAAAFLAIALIVENRSSWIPAVLVAIFGWELQESHTMPHGPIAFALLIVAGVWLWRTRQRPSHLTKTTAA